MTGEVRRPVIFNGIRRSHLASPTVGDKLRKLGRQDQNLNHTRLLKERAGSRQPNLPHRRPPVHLACVHPFGGRSAQDRPTCLATIERRSVYFRGAPPTWPRTAANALDQSGFRRMTESEFPGNTRENVSPATLKVVSTGATRVG